MRSAKSRNSCSVPQLDQRATIAWPRVYRFSRHFGLVQLVSSLWSAHALLSLTTSFSKLARAVLCKMARPLFAAQAPAASIEPETIGDGVEPVQRRESGARSGDAEILEPGTVVKTDQALPDAAHVTEAAPISSEPSELAPELAPASEDGRSRRDSKARPTPPSDDSEMPTATRFSQEHATNAT
eukprot:3949997-Pleurochrysis_carterae.AAC.1